MVQEEEPMKPCRSKNQPRQPSGTTARRTAPEPPVHRHIHPIQTAAPMVCDPTEQMLCAVLDTLRRQTELLEELLRRTERP